MASLLRDVGRELSLRSCLSSKNSGLYRVWPFAEDFADGISWEEVDQFAQKAKPSAGGL